jgi:hypothetical protein
MGAIRGDPGDEEAMLAVARALADSMTAAELRAWCSENGVVRSHGDTKMETALKAVAQRPDLAAEEALG